MAKKIEPMADPEYGDDFPWSPPYCVPHEPRLSAALVELGQKMRLNVESALINQQGGTEKS